MTILSRQDVRRVGCPECGAGPGKPCEGPGGPRESNHAGRVKKARKTPPREPETPLEGVRVPGLNQFQKAPTLSTSLLVATALSGVSKAALADALVRLIRIRAEDPHLENLDLYEEVREALRPVVLERDERPVVSTEEFILSWQQVAADQPWRRDSIQEMLIQEGLVKEAPRRRG